MIITPHASFNRPANTTQYADGDLISNSATDSEFKPLGFNISRLSGSGGAIKAVRIYKDENTTTEANFFLNLYTRNPNLIVADNAALPFVDRRYWVGAIALDMSSGASAGSGGNLYERIELSNPILIDPKAYDAENPTIYGTLEAEGAYAPASGELFEITLEISDSI